MQLNTHTYYSLRYGVLSPRSLLEELTQRGIKQWALTDINNTSATLEALKMAPEFGSRISVGVDFRNGAQQQFIALAQSPSGLTQINRYLSEHQQQHKAFPERAPEFSEVLVIYPFARSGGFALRPNEFIGVKPRDLGQLLYQYPKTLPKHFVALQTMSFRHGQDFNTHRLLRAVQNNSLLSKLPKSAEGDPQDLLCSAQALEHTYNRAPELLERARSLLDHCVFALCLDPQKPKNQNSYTGNTALDQRLLKKLAQRGLGNRYPSPTESKVLERLDKELDLIIQKGFVAYFLINWKIVRYAQSKGYFYVGRGSGANSLVAYLLRITDVDPIELDLYFERFINLYRTNPPDFDLDFSWTDRDDVTKFIFKRFKHTALIAVYNTFKHKAAIRELGKVFGLPKTEIDRLAKGRYQYQDLDHMAQYVVRYSKRILGFPNYLGIHAGGIIIAQEPIHSYTATFLPPKGYPTTHFDMVVAEDIGLYKFDILSQRGLGKIKETMALIKKNHPNHPPIDIHDLKGFKSDPKIKDLLRNAKAIGCFYVESPAMRMLLRKLQVDHYLGLVAASSIIRPGVAQSGMMREYILRYRDPQRRAQAHPTMMALMPETFGVMVYQEDVIKVAHYFGGLSLGEADMLRRGMSGKFRSKDEFAKVKNLFFERCSQSGKPPELTQEVWRQIESFAGYAFAKGHSASYAVESYQSLFLKAYFPLEYMVATVNNGGGFYQPEFYLHEARMHGATIVAPCINTSEQQTRIIGTTIYLGLGLLYALEQSLIEQIVTQRQVHGTFEDLDDFIERIPIAIESLLLLIKIDAFRSTLKPKRTLLWEAHSKLKKNPKPSLQQRIFRTKPLNYSLPPLGNSPLEDAFDQIELLGFALCDPFDLLRTPLHNTTTAADLMHFKGCQVEIYGYLVTTKYTQTNKGTLMYFGTFLDQEGAFVDTVHFPPIAQKYPFRGRGIYAISGKVVAEFDCITIEVKTLEIQPIIEDPRYAQGQVSARLQSKHYRNV
ncbi:MAG: DNA polymerase III subunit alpha [Cryomorphaceae bacterium BACL21 MAG-121220-bin10]|nr:MAG: DNA polymerase III subunit alpha [Cryomorphaceae bacterium BACL21 MAG-121220-bin10]